MRLSRPASLVALLLTATPALAWPLGGPLYTSRYPVPPSFYGYPLDDQTASYYGGSRYRQYYSYGRGYGLADVPGPIPNYRGRPPLDSRRYEHLLYGPEPPPPPRRIDPVAHLVVLVPADAEVWLEGTKTQQGGEVRLFVTPQLELGERYSYEVRARWQQDGKVVEKDKKVYVRMGDKVTINFTPGP